jgi:type I restriction enzyme S subunit
MKFESEDIVFTPITSLLSEVIDNRGRTCPTAETGIPLIATNCIGNENLYPVKKNIRHVSLETYNTWFRGHPEPGDVIFVNKGTPGRVCLVPDPIDFCIAQDMVSLRVNEHINNLYLLAAIRSPQVQNQIQQMQVGTMIPHFKKGDFEKLLIPMWDMPTQKAIGKIYFELSQKIDINERTSKTLEGIAQTIFKSWFIDFDPVTAKMAGEKPAGIDDAIAALFPDSMEESELGLIPKGWKAGTIGEICDSVVNGSTPLRTNSAYWSSDDISWFKTGELSDNFLFESKESITQLALEKTSVKVLPRGSVLMAIYAAPTVGRLGILTKSASFNQACTGMVAKNKFGTPYLYLTLFNRRFWFNSLAIGAAQQNISKVIVEGCPAITASQDVHNAFLKITEPIFTQIETLGRQSNSLALIRDSLLPRLISGELQIPDEMLAS